MLTNEVISLIVGYSKLPTGWANGAGVPASQEAVHAALRLTDVLKDVHTNSLHVALSEGGDIVISFRIQKKFLEVIVDGCLFDVFIEEDGKVDFDDLSFTSFSDLERFLSTTWTNLFVFSEVNTLSKRKTDLVQQPSFRMAVVYRSLKKSVQRQAPELSVTTSNPSTLHPFQMNMVFTGNSTPIPPAKFSR